MVTLTRVPRTRGIGPEKFAQNGAPMITSLALSPSIDITYLVPGLRIGAINRPLSVHRVPGGKGLNVARAAHRLGADVAALAVLGGTTGSWIAEQLAVLGLPLHPVDVDSTTRTCVSIADEGNRMTEVYEPAAAVTAEEWSAVESVLTALLTVRPGWVTISGSIPEGHPSGAVTALTRIARGAGCQVAVDLHGQPLLDALAAGPDLVKVNADEAAEALRAGAGATPADLAEQLAARAEVGAVVTAGVDGVHGFCHVGGARHVRSDTQGPYPVGSGDALLAALVTGLDRGDPLIEALVPACAVATANALAPGAGCFDPVDADRVRSGLEVR